MPYATAAAKTSPYFRADSKTTGLGSLLQLIANVDHEVKETMSFLSELHLRRRRELMLAAVIREIHAVEKFELLMCMGLNQSRYRHYARLD